MYYEHNTLWSKFRVIAASDSQSICALRYAWATRKLRTICCLHERDFALRLSRRWNRPRVKWSRARTIVASSRAKYNRHRKSQVLLTRRRFFSKAIAASESRLVWVTALRERFSRIKNLRIALQKVARVNAAYGRLLTARIDILPFFFLKSRRSLTRRKIHVWFCLRDIARYAPRKIKS